MKLKNLLNRPFDRVRITLLGKFFSVFTLFFGIATINSGNNLLYMILSYLLILLFASGIMSTANILFLDIEIIGQEEIYKNRTGYLLVKVRKRKNPGFFLYFCIGDGCAFVPILRKNSVIIKVPYKGTKRGIQKVLNIKVYSLFPFGFAQRWRNIDVDAKVLVFPSIDKDVEKEYMVRKYLLGEEDSNTRGFDGEFRGLGRYRVGESLYHIHWKKSYKELNIKEFGTMERDNLVFWLSSEADESDIDSVASIIHRKIREGKNVGLLVENKFYIAPSTGHTHELHLMRRLALL